MAPKMTCTYFDFAGPAEPIRLALAMTGEEWVDNRIKGEELPALKPTLPHGQLPVLEVDGKVICQSLSILRYVGKIAGIYPTDALEAAYADMAADAVIDSHLKLYPTMIEKDPAKKMEMRREMAEEFLPMWLGNLEKNLKAAGGEYFAGGKLSTGDLSVVCRLEWFNKGALDGIPAGIVDGYPLLSALMKRVYDEPRIVAYKQRRAAAAAAAAAATK